MTFLSHFYYHKSLNFSKAGLLALLLFTLFACQKSPINGDLDGQWQVMEVTPEAPVIIHERLYYNFSLNVCMLSYYGGGITYGNMNYDQENHKLYLDFPHGNGLNTIEVMKQFGIYSNPIIFDVSFINKNNLILKDGEVTVVLRKF